MTAELVETIQSTIQPNDHPYMQGAWRPTFNEWNAIFANGDAEVIGTIPADIDGVYVRTGENQVHDPIGRYHPFDGDGFIHAISLNRGVRAIAAASSAPRGSRPRRKPGVHYGRG